MNDEHDLEAAGLEPEVVERRLDWALGEVVGDERAPDVVMAVMARRAAQLVESQQVRVRGGGGPLLNAAVLVLGLVVVAWVMFASRGVDEAGAPGGHEPEFVVVSTMAQLRELSADTRAVELRDLGNDGFVALAKQCPEVERLRVRGRGPDGRAFVMFRDGVAEQDASLDGEGTSVFLALLDAYGDLADLDISGCASVDRPFVMGFVQSEGLSSIAIGGTSVGADIIGFFEHAPQLRRIDFGDAPWVTLEMVEHLLMRGKRVRIQRPVDADFERRVADLTVLYLRNLDVPYYRQVATIDELRLLPQSTAHIELRGLGDAAMPLLARRERLRGVAIVGDVKNQLSDGSMQQLAEMSQLVELGIMVSRWNGSGVEHLAGMANLRKLTLGFQGLRPMSWLGELTSLRELRLNLLLDAGMIGALSRCRNLQVLEMPSVTGDDASLARIIGGLHQLRRLRLPGQECGVKTMAAIGTLARLEALDLSGNVVSTDRHPMPRLLPLGQLRSLISLTVQTARLEPGDLLSLPTSLRGLKLVWCTGLDATAGAVLRDRFPGLVTLELNQPDWLDDDGLRAILAAPSLEHLTVMDSAKTTPAVLPAILAAKNLRHLDASRSTFLDDAAAETLRRERPDLQVVRKVW